MQIVLPVQSSFLSVVSLLCCTGQYITTGGLRQGDLSAKVQFAI